MNNININWFKPGGSDVCQFSYNLMIKSEDMSYSRKYSTNKTNYNVKNLKSCIRYDVTITVLYNNHEYGSVTRTTTTKGTGSVYKC